MSTSLCHSLFSSTLDATPTLDARGFHAAVMDGAAPTHRLALALREMSLETERLMGVFLRDELAIFWPSWR